jgi:hypothetical protein
MSTCIAAIWERPETAKDELLDRLRNAIVLISQADEIALEPIALSLTFAAIEALVCEEGEVPVNKQVKRHVATLLVQDPAKRKGKKGTEAVIDKLYDIRSKVLHGSKIHWPEVEELNEAGRSVASGVILAVAYWRENQLKCGFRPSITRSNRMPRASQFWNAQRHKKDDLCDIEGGRIYKTGAISRVGSIRKERA